MLSRIGKKDKKNTSLIDGIVSSDEDRYAVLTTNTLRS